MKQVLYIVDVQPCFNPPVELVNELARLAKKLHTVASVERHNEDVTPFEAQLGWKPSLDDNCSLVVDRTFVKYGYAPSTEAIDYLKSLNVDRVLVCGIQADTCVLAAGFSLFDAGLYPTLLPWLTVGSSLDRSGDLGARLWRHHFKAVLESEGDIFTD